MMRGGRKPPLFQFDKAGSAGRPVVKKITLRDDIKTPQNLRRPIKNAMIDSNRKDKNASRRFSR
jgi:hypothetical protein